jgi:hypothetical protein
LAFLSLDSQHALRGRKKLDSIYAEGKGSSVVGCDFPYIHITYLSNIHYILNTSYYIPCYILLQLRGLNFITCMLSYILKNVIACN